MSSNNKSVLLKDVKEIQNYRNIKSSTQSRTRRPGPRPMPCRWCNKINCNHCQCMGYDKCDHKQGEQCPRQRYKRRLVCNPCEKHKLRTESLNGVSSGDSAAQSSDSMTQLSNSSNPHQNDSEKENNTDTNINNKEIIDTTTIEVNHEKKPSHMTTNQSFNALLKTASIEYKKEVFKRSLSSLDTSLFTSNSVLFYPPPNSSNLSPVSQKLYKGFKRTPEPLDDDNDVGLDLDMSNGDTSSSRTNEDTTQQIKTNTHTSTEQKHNIKSESINQTNSKSPTPHSPVSLQYEPGYFSKAPLWKYKVNNPFSSSHLSPIPTVPDEPAKVPITITTNMFIEASIYDIDRPEFIMQNNQYILRLNEKSLSRHTSTDQDHHIKPGSISTTDDKDGL